MNVEYQLALKADFDCVLLRWADPFQNRTVDVVAQRNVRLARPRSNALDSFGSGERRQGPTTPKLKGLAPA
jgi:hypothetical protein